MSFEKVLVHLSRAEGGNRAFTKHTLRDVGASAEAEGNEYKSTQIEWPRGQCSMYY